MRSAQDCLAKAADMERQAGLCPTLFLRTEFLAMAQSWRHVAQQALWQDAWASVGHSRS